MFIQILYTETDGLGMIYILLEMFRVSRETEFMDENQVFDICTSFLKKKCGEKIQPKGTDLVKSYFNIKDKNIMKKLEDIPFFGH